MSCPHTSANNGSERCNPIQPARLYRLSLLHDSQVAVHTVTPGSRSFCLFTGRWGFYRYVYGFLGLDRFLLFHCSQGCYTFCLFRVLAILSVYRMLGMVFTASWVCCVLQVPGSASHGGVPSEAGAGAWGRCDHNSPHCALPHPLPRQNHPAHSEPVSPQHPTLAVKVLGYMSVP